MLQKINGKWMFTDAFYGLGKKVVQVYIPALSSLYFGLGNIWGFPAVEQVVGSFAVLATFIGVCLGLSSKNYDASEARYDGDLVTYESEEGDTVTRMEFNEDPLTTIEKKEVKLKVVPVKKLAPVKKAVPKKKK